MATQERLAVFDTHNGQILRTVNVEGLPGKAGGPVAVDSTSGDAIVAQAVGSGVAIVDIKHGKIRRMVAVAPDISALVTPPGTQRVFIARDGTGRMRMGSLDSRTGRVLRIDTDKLQLALGREVRTLTASTGFTLLGIDVRREHAFVAAASLDPRGAASGPSRVMMLDMRSGRTLHTATIGIDPTTWALDGRHGRLIVATAGERDRSQPYWPPRGMGQASVIDTASGHILRQIRIGTRSPSRTWSAQGTRSYSLAAVRSARA